MPGCATGSARSRAPPRSGRGRPTCSPARRARRSTGCRYCCCPATSSPRRDPRSRAAAARGFRRAATSRSTTAFQPVSRYWDRVQRPDQLIPAALAAMRVLTDQAETGAVTLALPQDVQTEAYDFPAEFLEHRVWHVPRPLPDRAEPGPGGGAVAQRRAAADRCRRRRASTPRRPTRCGASSRRTGSRSARRRPGRARFPTATRSNLGAIGATGTFAANRLAAAADLVLGIGTRWGDFTTASWSAFQHPDVRLRQPQRRELRRRQAFGFAARRRRPRDDRGARRAGSQAGRSRMATATRLRGLSRSGTAR